MAEKTAKRVTFSKTLGGKNFVEFGGGQYDMAALRKQAVAQIEQEALDKNLTGLKVSQISLYIQPENGVCYFTAPSGEQEFSGKLALA